VFISYSHADRAWVERLKRMMAPLLRGDQELRLWDDSRIAAGTEWRPAIAMALAETRVALLLVSDHFLASNFVMGEEMPKLLAAARADGVPVLWVSLSPCFVEETEIHRYQAVLPLDRHLEEMEEVEVKKALKTIGQAIRKALQAPGPAGPRGSSADGPSGDGMPAAPRDARELPPRPPQPDPRASPAGKRPTEAGPEAAKAAGPSGATRTALATQPLQLETARIQRQGDGWRVERRPLRLERALLELGEGVSLPLLPIPAGEFVMGSPTDEPERRDVEGPQHRVRLESFWMGQTPITQAQWRAVARLVPPLGQRWGRELKATPSRFQPRDDQSALPGRFALLPGEQSSDQRPVEQVSWWEAMEYCRRLDSLLPAGSGLRFTLPSEAQWEYACRAGGGTPFHFGATLSTELANYDGNATYDKGPKGEYRLQTTPVGQFPANDWGLLDMHGNVWEWCLDHWHGNYNEAPYDGSPWLDPDPRESSGRDDKGRLLRGGSWNFNPGDCRSAYRGLNQPVDAGSYVGFRVVCLPQAPSLHS
jgi:formylglycine-generating enzyme required for sulfatase activity